MNNSHKKSRKTTAKPVDNKTYIGTFKSHEYYGFIEEGGHYVRWENINTALNKDTVEYTIIEHEDYPEEKRYEARIVQVLKRHKVLFSGDLIHKDKDYCLVLLSNQKLNKVVTTPYLDLPLCEKVIVRLTSFHLDDLKGEIVKQLGNKSDFGVEIRAILSDFEIEEEFSEKVKKEVEKIKLDIEGHRKDKGRLDFTEIPVVTIDPSNSKDFDDAICVLREGDKYRLYVAIADVWSYIRGSPNLTKEANHRGTSIYYLDSVIPMIPEKLCNNFCSLVPNEERCALVLEVLIDKKGNILRESVRINPGIIRSRRRFNYDEVNEFFEGKIDFKEESEEVREVLKVSYELFKLLEKQRRDKGYVALDAAETKIEVNDKNQIISCYQYIRGDAQFMIEEFMILANESVAIYLVENNIPALFRVHDRPEPNKIAHFIGEVKKLNFIIRDGDENIDQKVIFRWFTENKDHPLIDIIGTLLLRSLHKAAYSITNIGHFGLNLKHYLHFTSPIRRFPDTIVHRMLWEYDFEKKKKPKDAGDKIFAELDEIAKHCTEKEIEATEVSRTIENVKLMQFLNTKLDNVFKARVISPSKFGAFIKLEEECIEGYVKCKDMLKLGDFLLVKPLHDSKEFKLIKVFS